MAPISKTQRPRGVSLVKRTDFNGRSGPPTARQGISFTLDNASLARILKYMQILMVIGAVIVTVLLSNFSATRYRLFATTNEGKLYAPPPINQEIGDNIVNLWLVNAMTKTLTMGFHDYQLRLMEIRPLFNDQGWESYSKFLRSPYDDSPSLRSMLENSHLMVEANPRSPPQILEKSLIGTAYTYRISIKVTLELHGVTTTKDGARTNTFELLLKRVPPEINPSGIAIAQWRRIDDRSKN